jgi:uncharacterized SAM-binding protein YcdF (DUF218 family)
MVFVFVSFVALVIVVAVVVVGGGGGVVGGVRVVVSDGSDGGHVWIRTYVCTQHVQPLLYAG